jgi:hypothetical protein
MNGAYNIIASDGVLVDGKAAEPMVIEAMHASGIIDPSHGAVQCNSLSPVVVYFPADGYTSRDVLAALSNIIDTVLPTQYFSSVNV